MLWALLFFLAFCALVIGAILRLGRGSRGTRVTGPLNTTVDYDNPYGRGAYFWTNQRPPERHD